MTGRWHPVRLVFYQLLPGRLMLDAITEVGHPFVLETRLPAALWAVVAVAALDRWSSDSRQIAFLIREGRHGRQLELSDGNTRITLDVLNLASPTRIKAPASRTELNAARPGPASAGLGRAPHP